MQPSLITADCAIPQLEGEGTEVFPRWKIKALIKAATGDRGEHFAGSRVGKFRIGRSESLSRR